MGSWATGQQVMCSCPRWGENMGHAEHLLGSERSPAEQCGIPGIWSWILGQLCVLGVGGAAEAIFQPG